MYVETAKGKNAFIYGTCKEFGETITMVHFTLSKAGLIKKM